MLPFITAQLVIAELRKGLSISFTSKHRDVSSVCDNGGFSEQEQICAPSPPQGFTVEPKATSQGQLQQKTEMPITSQSLQGKSIFIPASDTIDLCGSRTWPADLRATRLIPDNSCASSRAG